MFWHFVFKVTVLAARETYLKFIGRYVVTEQRIPQTEFYSKCQLV